MKKTIFISIFTVAIMLLMSGCADVSNVEQCLQPQEHTYGFWGGTWHGFIMAFSFIGSLFSDSIAVYAVNNNGAWYDFGFVGGFFFLLKIIGNIIKVLFR
jgi:hypothetical protein